MVKEKEIIIKLLTVLFPDVTIYLFGSRATGKATERSDIDLALDIGQRMTTSQRSRAMNVLEALNIPQKIDIVDLHSVPETLKKVILTEGEVWKK